MLIPLAAQSWLHMFRGTSCLSLVRRFERGQSCSRASSTHEDADGVGAAVLAMLMVSHLNPAAGSAASAPGLITQAAQEVRFDAPNQQPVESSKQARPSQILGQSSTHARLLSLEHIEDEDGQYLA